MASISPNAEHPLLFEPPYQGATPNDLFKLTKKHYGPRYVNITDSSQVLAFIDGACLGNGTPDARGGYGVHFRAKGNVAERIESAVPQTSNRAELRAALAALDLRRSAYCPWCVRTLVLACDAEYVARGVCEWLPRWRANGWRTARGSAVANRDLWERLMEELENGDGDGMRVLFWRIPRELNTEADALAREGALKDEAYSDLITPWCCDDCVRKLRLTSFA